MEATVHSHSVESFEGLLQRCRRGRGRSELWKNTIFPEHPVGILRPQKNLLTDKRVSFFPVVNCEIMLSLWVVLVYTTIMETSAPIASFEV